MATKKYVRISVDLTPDEYKDLHQRVIEIGCPKSEFVRRAIKKSLAENGNVESLTRIRLHSSNLSSTT